MGGEERPLHQIQGDFEHAANLKILSPTVDLRCIQQAIPADTVSVFKGTHSTT